MCALTMSTCIDLRSLGQNQNPCTFFTIWTANPRQCKLIDIHYPPWKYKVKILDLIIHVLRESEFSSLKARSWYQLTIYKLSLVNTVIWVWLADKFFLFPLIFTFLFQVLLLSLPNNTTIQTLYQWVTDTFNQLISLWIENYFWQMYSCEIPASLPPPPHFYYKQYLQPTGSSKQVFKQGCH